MFPSANAFLFFVFSRVHIVIFYVSAMVFSFVCANTPGALLISIFSQMYCKFYEQVGACVHELDDPRCTKIHREDLCSEVVIVRGYHELRLGNVDGTYEVYFKQFRNLFGNVGFFHLIGNRGPHLRGGFLLKLFSTEMASNAVNFFNNIDGVYARLWHCRSNLNSAVCFSYVPGGVDVEKLACTIKRPSFCMKGDLCHFLHFLPISLLLLQRDALMPFARNGHGIKCGNARVGADLHKDGCFTKAKPWTKSSYGFPGDHDKHKHNVLLKRRDYIEMTLRWSLKMQQDGAVLTQGQN